MLRNLFFFYFQVTFSASLPSPLLKLPKMLQGEQSEMSFRRYQHNSLGDLLHFFPIIITLFLFTYSVPYFSLFLFYFDFFWGGRGGLFSLVSLFVFVLLLLFIFVF